MLILSNAGLGVRGTDIQFLDFRPLTNICNPMNKGVASNEGGVCRTCQLLCDIADMNNIMYRRTSPLQMKNHRLWSIPHGTSESDSDTRA